MRYVRRTSAVLVSSVLLLGPGLAAAAADTGGDAVMRVNLSGTIDSLNPFLASNQAALNVLTLQYEALARSGPDATNVPDLASEWTAEGTTWTYTMRPDLQWSDGEPLTVDDVLWTYNAILDNPELATQNGGFVESVTAVSSPDENTVVVETKSPQAPNPVAGIMIVPEHVWKDIAKPAEFENTEPTVGSGPYLLSEYSRGSSAILTANDKFWRGAPALAGINFIQYKNTDAAIQALRTGELDLVGDMTVAQYDSLDGVEGITRNEADSTDYKDLSINPGAADQQGNPIGNGAEMLKDQEFRQAIRQAMDQEMLVERVLAGHGSVGAEIMPPGRPAYYWDEADMIDPYSPEDAASRLDAAGYTAGADGKRLGKDGKPIELRLSFDASSTGDTQTAQFVQTWLEELGITIVSQPTDWDQMAQDAAEGTYDMYINQWGVGIDPDYMLSINTCSALPESAGAANPSSDNWCNPEFDALYSAQHTETDEAKRKEIVKDALSLHYESAVAIILYYPNPLQAYRSDHVTNLTPYAGDINYYWAYADAKPIAGGVTSGGGGMEWLLPVGIGAVVVVGAVAALLIVRRKKTAEDRE